MTSRERLLAVLKGEMPDRVPISCHELVGYDTANYVNKEPSYHSLMEVVREKTDCMALWDPAGNAQLALSAADPGIVRTRKENPDGHTDILEVEVGGRLLRSQNRVIDGVYTTWTTEPLCKTPEDVEALLSIPYVPVTYSNADAPRIRAELGDRGILMPSVGDAAFLAMSTMEFGESTVFVMEEPDRFEEVVKEFHRRNMTNLENQLKTTDSDLIRICGPEYMCPPYLPPRYFERFMLPYLSDMVDLIHRYGRLVRIHCHGRIGRVVDMIAETGCDGTDPCEETPDGDITLESLKARVGSRLTLFGSMQFKLLEAGTTEDVIRETTRMMQAGKPGGRFVLMPTAGPISVPLSPKTEENYRAYIDTALSLAEYR